MSGNVNGKSVVDILALDVEGDGGTLVRRDHLAVEAALEIQVAGAEPVITMRTPGHDRELAAGLMLSEGLAQQRQDLNIPPPLLSHPNRVRVVLSSPHRTNTASLQRTSLSTSACGVCGKKRLNLELMKARPPLPPGPAVSSELLTRLPSRLAAQQALFRHTGGLHAAALFDLHGEVAAIREDVGRHNALDKLLGWGLLNDRLPLHKHIVLLSGRASFELIQKCIMAGVAVVCAISAPSSYAVDLAREYGITLVGFLREGRFNIYAAPQRVLHGTTPADLIPPPQAALDAGQ